MNGFDISQLGLALNPKAGMGLMQQLGQGGGMGLLQMLAGGNPFGGGTSQPQMGQPQPTGAPGMPKPAAALAPLLSQIMGR